MHFLSRLPLLHVQSQKIIKFTYLVEETSGITAKNFVQKYSVIYEKLHPLLECVLIHKPYWVTAKIVLHILFLPFSCRIS